VSVSAQKNHATPPSAPRPLVGKVIWLYGLSGSGKSTLAEALAQQLTTENYVTQILDGDVLRRGLNRDLGFSEKDRTENIRRAAELAKLFADRKSTSLNTSHIRISYSIIHLKKKNKLRHQNIQ